MTIDLDELEVRIKERLSILEDERNDLLERLQAIQVVRKTHSDLERPEKPVSQAQANDEKPYKMMKQEQAVLDVIRKYPNPLSAPKVAEYLQKGGFPFTSGNPANSIYALLNRWCHEGKAEKIKQGKATVFKIPDQMLQE